MKSLIDLHIKMDRIEFHLERIADALDRLAPPIPVDIAPTRKAGLESLSRKTGVLSQAELERMMEEGADRRLEREYGWRSG